MSDAMFGRRGVITAGLATTSLVLGTAVGREAERKPAAGKKREVDAKEVGAVEDLMREHGILRRCFLVYRESAGKLRMEPSRVDAAALNDSANLFRTFGEDYHERKLEEAFIFPKVKTLLPGKAASVDILIAQHNRGREITSYVLAVTRGARVLASDAEPLARAFDAFEIMYANHTAREDTLVFPAWKNALASADLAEMGDRFETIERETFGQDGFDDALRRIGQIEDVLGLADLAQFTAPPVPQPSLIP